VVAICAIASLSYHKTGSPTMTAVDAEHLTVEVDETHRVSALLTAPPKARACYVLAHGAGAGMTHPFMASVAAGLAARNIAVLRYQFPYMEQRSKRPDPPRLAQATVRAAAAEAARRAPALALVAGGKSFGGRMTSQAQAAAPLPGVRGLAFLGFPLHPANRPSIERAKHLSGVRLPMLFLQGERDALADLPLIRSVTATLGPRASLHVVRDADHSFRVPARTGRKDSDVRCEMLDALVTWILCRVG
jgi:uncharacterized protein